jgi:predicted HTH transcriptional regulator
MYVILGIFVGLVAGYVLGRGRKRESNFADSEVAEAMGREGHVAVQARVERRKERILENARADGRITNDGVEDLFCISDRTATTYLGALVEEGRLERVGESGRGVAYVPR